MRTCPYCKEDILDTAIKCKHCGEFLENKVQAPEASTPMPPKTDKSTSCEPTARYKDKKRQNQIKSLMNILAWVFGVIFALSGVGSLIKTPLVAIVSLIMAGLLLPPVRQLLGDKTGITIPIFVRGIALLVLTLSLSFLSDHNATFQDKKITEAGGVSTITALHKTKKPGLSTKADSDKPLNQENKMQEEQRSERIVRLENSLTHTTSISGKLNIYEQLTHLAPDNSYYIVELASIKDELKRYKEELSMQRAVSRLTNHPRYKEGDTLIGEWEDTVGNGWSQNIIIVKNEGYYFRLSTFQDNSTSRAHLSIINRESWTSSNEKPATLASTGEKLKLSETTSNTGDFYILDNDGLLQLHDRNGFIRFATPRTK